MLMLYGLSCITNMIFSARDLIFWILAHIIYALSLVEKIWEIRTILGVFYPVGPEAPPRESTTEVDRVKLKDKKKS